MSMQKGIAAQVAMKKSIKGPKEEKIKAFNEAFARYKHRKKLKGQEYTYYGGEK